METLNNKLKKVNLWLQANKLSLNIKKTHVIIFKARRKKIDNIIVTINDTGIKQVESTKFLGIYIDMANTYQTYYNQNSKDNWYFISSRDTSFLLRL